MIADLNNSERHLTPALSPVAAEREKAVTVLTPVRNVREYLATRPAIRDYREERALFDTLPTTVRCEVEAMMAACRAIAKGTQGQRGERTYNSVHAGVVAMVRKYAHRGWTVKRFRTLFDNWDNAGDWVVLVNRSKAGGEWVTREGSAVPQEFLNFVAQRMARARRKEGKRQAWLSVVRQWQYGRTLDGKAESIPGYGYWQQWFAKHFPGAVLPAEAPLPRGWSEDNIMRLVKKHGKFTKSAQVLSHEGEAAARAHLPQVHMDRSKLRFMEEVQFDDVKTDWRIYDPKTDQVMDLWLLKAVDVATGMVLGFGMRPARVRDDDTQEHLKQRDIMQLFGWLLERYGLPPYVMTWKLENAVASVSDAQAEAIRELLGENVVVSFASMINGRSPVGYKERGFGNTKGKAVVESSHRLQHNISAQLPGQTGPNYGKRPADLIAREKECRQIRESTAHLPAHLQSQIQYPLFDLQQSRAALWECFRIANSRDDHRMQGFEKVIEWYDPANGKWLPQSTAPVKLPAGSSLRSRMQTPFERAAKLRAGLEWRHVSPITITALYEHNVRNVVVGANKEILIRFEDTNYRFKHTGKELVPGTKLLAYFHPNDLAFLHLTDGRGSFVGTWLNTSKVAYGDKEALAETMRYTAAERNAAIAAAAELAAPERIELEAMRARNAEVLQLATFVSVTDPTAPVKEFSSAAATAMVTTATAVKQAKRARAKFVRTVGAKAADDFLKSAPAAKPAVDDGSDFLKKISG